MRSLGNGFTVITDHQYAIFHAIEAYFWAHFAGVGKLLRQISCILITMWNVEYVGREGLHVESSGLASDLHAQSVSLVLSLIHKLSNTIWELNRSGQAVTKVHVLTTVSLLFLIISKLLPSKMGFLLGSALESAEMESRCGLIILL